MLLRRRAFLSQKAGVPIVLKKVCTKNPRKKRSIRIDPKLITSNPKLILEDPEIDIVIELMGGLNPAKSMVLKAINNGKSVITANKALLSMHGAELFAAAKKQGVDLYFEASVAGGIPIIKSLREGLVGNEIDGIYGILNGTTNFILTEMSRGEGRSFHAVLGEAQARGYAEKDPTLDLNGMDSAHKLSILTLLAFGKSILPNQMYVEGITGITSDDVRNAAKFGYAIRLLGIAKRIGSQLEVRVHPVLLSKHHALSSVNGVHNAVAVKGDWIGELMLYGPGAGRRATTSAVISDLVDVARNLAGQVVLRVAPPEKTKLIQRIRKMGELEGRYYIRFSCIDEPGVLSMITQILGRYRISIASVIQKDRRRGQAVPLVMMTHDAKEKDIQAALKQIDRLSVVKGKSVLIRMERG